MTEDARANAFADDFEAALARFAAGEPQPDPEAGDFASGECNNRSMSNIADHDIVDEDSADWEDEAAAEEETQRIYAAMAAERPADAPQLTGLRPDGTDRDPGGEIAEAQWEAYTRGVPRWWLVVAPWPWGGEGRWHFADDLPKESSGGD